jgi:O-antigen/teichoic acid export membrane protein
VIIALNRQRTLTIAFVVGAAFNVTANLIFIPLYSFVAASVITIFSEALLWIVFYVILRREMGAINWAAALWRIFAAGMVSAGVAFGAGTISPWIGLVGGVVAYGVMLAIIRPLDAEESKLFAGLLPGGIGRRVGGGKMAEEAGS